MIILSIRTDKPEAELGLYDDQTNLRYDTWQAHRQLAETLHGRIEAMLKSNSLDWADVAGIVAYQGPGSFTGLRIGLTVANTLAASLGRPIVAEQGADWQYQGISQLMAGQNQGIALPEYGAPVNITAPRK